MEYRAYKGNGKYCEEKPVSRDEIVAHDQTDEMIEYFVANCEGVESYADEVDANAEEFDEVGVRIECMPIISSGMAEKISKVSPQDYEALRNLVDEGLDTGEILPDYVRVVVTGAYFHVRDGGTKKTEMQPKEGYVDLVKFQKGIQRPLVEENAMDTEYSIYSAVATVVTPEQKFACSYHPRDRVYNK